jgi:hypothetical protein
MKTPTTQQNIQRALLVSALHLNVAIQKDLPGSVKLKPAV